jgi:predicted site-specific integrase-resolvase
MKRIIREKDLADEYTAKELAPFLDVSERQVHYYRTTGQLNSEKRKRCRYVFPKEDVAKFMTNIWGYEYER